ncbi:MAG: hypothetical protein ACUVQ8_01425 [Nitrososphaeria archaeon]
MESKKDRTEKFVKFITQDNCPRCPQVKVMLENAGIDLKEVKFDPKNEEQALGFLMLGIATTPAIILSGGSVLARKYALSPTLKRHMYSILRALRRVHSSPSAA